MAVWCIQFILVLFSALEWLPGVVSKFLFLFSALAWLSGVVSLFLFLFSALEWLPCVVSLLLFLFSALAWLAGLVSLNDLRLAANLPGDNFKTAVAGDGKLRSHHD